jgi:hypothetical protein
VLLEHQLLSEHAAAARVWRHRERIEREAAVLFDELASELAATGAPAALAGLARRAADDERDHAVRCRALVDAFDASLAPLEPRPPRLGPPELSRADRALYTSVAMGCVTETLSTAILIVMRDSVTDERVRETVHSIARDEVAHARLGWAHLAFAAERSPVAWLSEHVGGMLAAALATELPEQGVPRLDGLGVLSRDRVERAVRETTERVIVPGFARYAIETSALGHV